MVILGCKPKGRLTEQHDVFFGIAHTLKELLPSMKVFWPEAKGNFHIDSWREVIKVGDYKIDVVAKSKQQEGTDTKHLFFINLGGYKEHEMEEFHYKMLLVGEDSADAILQGKQSAFYKHTGFKGANSHIDDKYGVDTDDLFNVADILDTIFKEKYALKITIDKNKPEDELNIGYLPIKKLLSA